MIIPIKKLLRNGRWYSGLGVGVDVGGIGEGVSVDVGANVGVDV
jgi:hypothetical protein